MNKEDLAKTKLIENSSEKGMTFLVTFFVMGIVLAIVIGITVILISEIRLIREMGYSVSAFFAGDTGLEKTLYYDRKEIPQDANRGICNICNVCTDCDSCSAVPGISPTGCDPSVCNDCTVSYSTIIDGDRNYDVKAKVTPDGSDVFQAIGRFQAVSRSVELSSGAFGGPGGGAGPVISNALVTPRSIPSGIQLDIQADIEDPDGLDTTRLMAYVQYPDGNTLGDGSLEMQLINGITYGTSWQGPVGVYYVDITACDTLGNCTTLNNI